MTVDEQSHRDFYLAMKRARGDEALRVCNRMPKREARALSEPLPVAPGAVLAA